MSTDMRSVQVPSAVHNKLLQVRRRDARLRFLAGTMSALAAFLLVMMTAMLIDWTFTLFSTSTRVVLTTTSLIAGGMLLLAWGLRPLLTRHRLADVALDVDEAVPGLEERWSTVAEMSATNDPPEKRGAAAMIAQVTREAEAMEDLVTPEAVATTERVRGKLYVLSGVCAALLLAVVADWQQTSVLLRRFWQPGANISLTKVVAVTGDAVVAESEPLHLQAKVENRLQAEAILFVRDSRGEEQEPISLLPNAVGGEEFGYKIAAVEEPFEYRLRSGDGQTPWHQVTVVERPQLTAVDFKITPPKYSKLSPVTEKGLPRRVRALEESNLEVTFQSSVPLDHLSLKLGNDSELQLIATEDGRYSFKTTLTGPLTLSPILTSKDGLKNERPPSCRITVYRDRAPSVKITTPDDEIAVRADDKVTVEFAAKDDFGITKAELVVFEGHGEDARELKAVEIPLGEQQGTESVQGETELDLKEFELKQGSELSYAVRVFDTKNTTASSSPGDSSSETKPSDPSQSSQDSEQKLTSNDSKPGEQGQAGKPSPGSGKPSESEPGKTSKNPDDPLLAKSNDQEQDKQDSQDSKSNSSSSQSQPGLPGKNKKKPSKGELAGAPKPGNEMTRRALDVGQCTTCKSMRLTIDEWAGSFEGQARKKLQLAIEPYLKQLDEALAAAEETISPLVKQAADPTWSDAQTEEGRKTDRHLVTAEEVIVTLRGKTVETPYAFIGLQLVEIGQSHIGPARDNLAEAVADEAQRRAEDLQQSRHHIRRARELLAKLTWQYELVKINEKLAEEMVRVKKMHQFFIEGTFALLKSKKPLLNPKSRKFIEFEIDEEFRKKLQELLEKKRDIQAELAKALAKDPRLLNRYMARTRLQADTLRDQLTILARKQQALSKEVAAWQQAKEEDRNKLAAEHVRASQLQAAAKISTEASLLLDNFVTWTPLDLDPSEGELGKLHEAATALATTSRAFAEGVAGGEDEEARKQAQMLHRQLKEFAERLPDALNDHPEHDRLAVHVANRLTETNKLITRASGWIYQAQNVEDGSFHLAAEVEQHRIATDTAELTRKFENLRSWLAGMPNDIQDLGEMLFLTLNDELLPDLTSVQLTLQQNRLKRTVKIQSDAVESFAKAEKQCDALMDRIIEEMDSKPVDTKLRWEGPVETKSLEDLLAMLEDEAKACEGLGIPCCRPNNLMLEKDWLMPGNGSGGGGSGGQLAGAMAQGQTAAKQTGRMQRALQKAIRNMTKQGETGADDATKGRREQIRWNTLASQLEDKLRQGRGHIPPEQYRRAIERYFELIAAEEKQPRR